MNQTPGEILRIKRAVRRRDGRCVDCGISAKDHFVVYRKLLQVHRLIPGSPYSLEACESLCQPCHSKKPKRPPGTLDNLRCYFDVDDRLRWALRLMAADRNLSSVAQLVREVIEEAAREKLAEVDRRMARGESPTAGKSPRGRKKKAD